MKLNLSEKGMVSRDTLPDEVDPTGVTSTVPSGPVDDPADDWPSMEILIADAIAELEES